MKFRHFLSLKTRTSIFNIKSIKFKVLQLSSFSYIYITSFRLKHKEAIFLKLDEKLATFIYLLMNVCKDESIT